MTVYLCTDEAWNINGKIFHVAGGDVSLAAEEMPVRQIRRWRQSMGFPLYGVRV